MENENSNHGSAYAGMTQCYHGEREQQPWIPAIPAQISPAIPAKLSPVIPAKAGIHKGAPIIKQSVVYIMASKAKGVLYTGVTSNLKNRMSKYRTWLSGNSGK